MRRGRGLVRAVLAHFGAQRRRQQQTTRGSAGGGADPASARAQLRVRFDGEDGVDEGGLSKEMFRLFFEGVVEPRHGLFCTADDDADGASGGDGGGGGDDDDDADDAGADGGGGGGAAAARRGGALYLPRRGPYSPRQLEDFEAFGRALVTAFFDGQRAGSLFGPSLFKYLARGARHDAAADGRALRDLKAYDSQLGARLQWVLETPLAGCELEFEFGGRAPAETLTDANKHRLVVAKVKDTLIAARLGALEAVRRGFEASLEALSAEARPFLRLLSSTDWSVLLCGDDEDIPADVVVRALDFAYFTPSRRSPVPGWFSATVRTLSPDRLRRFLVFATGAASLPAGLGSGAAAKFEIHVRVQPRSPALPVAHTCFNQIDCPDYPTEAEFISKFMTALYECGTFDFA